MRTVFIQFFLTTGLCLGSLAAKAGPAENMSLFLKSCAYGTLAGAGAGLATLAWSENPNGKISNVARGASLGLYAGIAYGAYLLNQPTKKSELDQVSQGLILPAVAESRIQGADFYWAFSF